LKKANRIQINGLVQGVGFRPFVYRVAHEMGICGWVNNTGHGVNIHAEGTENDLQKFYCRILKEKPPIAEILSVCRNDSPLLNYGDFIIIRSEGSQENDVLISPDVATCMDCLQEMYDPEDRRYLYPFINCTNCGPRYSIIFDRPYDRDKTTMNSFEMCNKCRQEYEEPTNRRFHAQPVACEICGPQIKLLDSDGNEIKDRGIGAGLLKDGAILAVKGIGGFHLVCDATNDNTVRRLREIKERGAKPFAVMAGNLETAETEVRISELEKSILQSPAAPIILLTRINRENSRIAPEIAPGLHTLGVVLPYTPVHHLLINSGFDFLVMTSANLSGQPLIYENSSALKQLRGIADYYLVSDRDIFHPCDDSVVQVVDGKMTFIRRARGFVPLPLILDVDVCDPIAALGGEMKNAFCLASGNRAFMSQYIGDMHGLENMERFKQEYVSYQKVTGIIPGKIACDLHPEYSTTKIAKSMDFPQYSVQHHHAHLVSVMGEHSMMKPAQGLICDGTGYGEDGKIWGFEFLYGNARGYKRKAHLEYLPLPGGDAGAKKPLRIAWAYCKRLLSGEDFSHAEPLWDKLTDAERGILDSQLRNNIQIFENSSAGRLFDAISALLGICIDVTYEGQAAIEMESRAHVWLNKFSENQKTTEIISEAKDRLLRTGEIFRDSDTCISKNKTNLIAIYNEGLAASKLLYPIWLDEKPDEIELKVNLLFRNIIRDCINLKDRGEISFRFHWSLAVSMLETAIIISPEERKLVIGGGVFQNKLLLEILLSLEHVSGLKIIYPEKLPAGDGGLALGQVLIANENSFARI